MKARLGPICTLALFVSGGAPAQDAIRIADRFELGSREGRRDLPGRLHEVSGLAAAPDGRLYAHDDERGIVYAIDPRTGAVDRGFTVGSTVVRDDFEGIAIAGERFFLITSRGILHEFRLAAEGGNAPARVTDTGLGPSCEVEGLAFHEASRSLLAACKTLAPPSAEVRIHRLPLDPRAPVPSPLRIPFAALEGHGWTGEVHPSGIEISPGGESMVLVAANEKLLIEADFEGRVLSIVRLRRGHPQAEGITFGADGRLYIADEGGNGNARLTWYGPATKEHE